MDTDNKDVPDVDTRNCWPENKILQADALADNMIKTLTFILC